MERATSPPKAAQQTADTIVPHSDEGCTAEGLLLNLDLPPLDEIEMSDLDLTIDAVFD
jgi:hypothetical protein